MTDDALTADALEPEAAPARAREPLLDQGEIDAFAGYSAAQPDDGRAGARGLLDSGAGPRDPLPMLAVVFEDLARRLSASLRGLFGGDVEVALGSLSPRRYADFIEDVVLPAQIVTFTAEGWNGDGLLAMGPDFARVALDALLGAGPDIGPGLVATRPFSGIEGAILTRLADAVLCDAEAAFRELVGPVAFRRGRVEADPRLGDVARPGDVALVAKLSLKLEGRRAEIAMLVPYAALAPVQGILARSFMGVRPSFDDLWSRHLSTEIWQSSVEAEAILHETALPLGQVLALAVGDTLMFDMKPSDLVEVRCGGLAITRGRMGRVAGRIAVHVSESPERPRAASQGYLAR